MKNLLSRFLKDNSGATAIEYGLIAAGISVAIIAVVNGLGTSNTRTSKAPAQRRSLLLLRANRSAIIARLYKGRAEHGAEGTWR